VAQVPEAAFLEVVPLEEQDNPVAVEEGFEVEMGKHKGNICRPDSNHDYSFGNRRRCCLQLRE